MRAAVKTVDGFDQKQSAVWAKESYEIAVKIAYEN